MNIISFDIEEWYIEKKYHGGHQARYQEFDRYLKLILDILEERNIKATFFCLGKMATDFPKVVKSIAARGHEIGCHSNQHHWLTKMTPEQLREDTIDALMALEDVCGNRVLSYRAPAFSIGQNNRWAIEILAQCGIKRDASIFPMERDFGGFASFPANFPVVISYNGLSIKEFTICTAKLFGKTLAYSGGGYFRLFPYCFVRNKIKSSEYAITYFHIGDLIHNNDGIMSRVDYEIYFKEVGSFLNRLKRYFKSNIGTKYAFDKLSRLINDCDFISIEKADGIIDWNNQAYIQF